MGNRRLRRWGLIGAIALAALAAPFASPLPDGLEWVAQTLGFAQKEVPLLSAPLAGYQWPHVLHERVSTALAGVLGTVAVFGIGWLLGKWLQAKGQNK